MDVRLEQQENTELPIEVTLGGMVIEVSLEQQENASLPMISVPFLILIL